MLSYEDGHLCEDAHGEHAPEAAEAVHDEGAAGVVQPGVLVQDADGEEDEEAADAADDDGLHGGAEEGDGGLGDEGAERAVHHLPHGDGVPVEAVAEDQAHLQCRSRRGKGAGGGAGVGGGGEGGG